MAGRTAKTVKAAKSGAGPKAKARAGASSAKGQTAKVASKAKTKAVKAQKKAVAKKAVAKKTVAKKAVAKRPVAKKSSVKKPAVKRPAAKKPAAKKSAAKKSSIKKSATKTAPKRAVDKVVSAARKVSKVKSNRMSALDAKLLAELTDMAKYIRAAKREIAAIRPDDVKDEYLPKAADELDAVVQATADATNTIMDACELVEGVMGSVSSEASNTLMEATTNIYEACTFQDITGQRITKVVDTMKHIEERIDALMAAFGSKRTKPKAPTRKADAPKTVESKKEITDADLLEGPQLGTKAKSQAEIDDLLASFD